MAGGGAGRGVNKGFGTTFPRARSIQPKFPTGLTGKSGPPQKVDQFSRDSVPVGPHRSIEFWTKISGNFG